VKVFDFVNEKERKTLKIGNRNQSLEKVKMKNIENTN
jgi:hypothetical protein